MELLKDYEEKQKQLFEYFGYVEDWVAIPVDDATEYVWNIVGTVDDGIVRFSDNADKINDEDNGDYYENEIYTQRHLPKWVYEGKDYTMIVVDTHTDGNKFLQIFDNRKRVNLTF